MTDDERKELAKKRSAIEGFARQPGWVLYVLPWIEERIAHENRVEGIDEKKTDAEIANTMRMKKAKIQVYKSLMRIPEMILGQIKQKEGGTGNG